VNGEARFVGSCYVRRLLEGDHGVVINYAAESRLDRSITRAVCCSQITDSGHQGYNHVASNVLRPQLHAA
jgi:hypothetical protein